MPEDKVSKLKLAVSKAKELFRFQEGFGCSQKESVHRPSSGWSFKQTAVLTSHSHFLPINHPSPLKQREKGKTKSGAAVAEQNPSIHEGVSGTFQAAVPALPLNPTAQPQGKAGASRHVPAVGEGRALHSWSSGFRAHLHSHYTSRLLSDRSTPQTTALPCCL